ncbi:MAG: non-heme iron oxygenase ferredoxin subunit [Nitrospirota bacterium]|nr:non-heme iron oxygenase ferredoxin subunit [Nitrospirota bacterium]
MAVPSFTKVARLSEIPEGRGFSVDIQGRRLALFRSGEKVYAIEDSCTHAEASLSMGFFDGEKVTCPLHFAEFRVSTGEVLEGPAEEPVKTYPVRIAGDDVELALD